MSQSSVNLIVTRNVWSDMARSSGQSCPAICHMLLSLRIKLSVILCLCSLLPYVFVGSVLPFYNRLLLSHHLLVFRFLFSEYLLLICMYLCMYVCMYICICRYVHMYVLMYVCVCMYVLMNVYVLMYTCRYVCICRYVHVCVLTCVCMYVLMYMCMYFVYIISYVCIMLVGTYVYIGMYIFMYTRTHTQLRCHHWFCAVYFQFLFVSFETLKTSGFGKRCALRSHCQVQSNSVLTSWKDPNKLCPYK